MKGIYLRVIMNEEIKKYKKFKKIFSAIALSILLSLFLVYLIFIINGGKSFTKTHLIMTCIFFWLLFLCYDIRNDTRYY